jgi:integrase
MASIIERSGSWYAKFKGPDGRPRRERINAATKAEARRLADDLERKAERQRRGLEPLLPKNGGETVGQLVSWWLDTYSKRTASHAITEAVVKKHILSSSLAGVPVGLLTSGQVEAFLVEREGEGLGSQSVNHLRRFLLTAFNRAIECGRFFAANPVLSVKRRRVVRRAADYLRPHEVAPLLTALDPSFRSLFATAIYTGLRKGELMALRKQDVDLEARLLTVAHSWDRDSTKGGHADRIPLAAEVVPFLDAAMRASSSELVFPAADGSMRSREFAVESILRRAMARAGLVTGYVHACRRKGCSHTEDAPNADLRRCPVDQRKLWPVAKVRPLRFHDLRHTTASLLMQAGASPLAVQRILRHRDVRITTDVYGHLAPGFLRAEIDKLTFDVASLVPKLAEPVRLAANAGPQGPYGVQAEKNASSAVVASLNSSTMTATSGAVPARFERATPGFGGQYSIQLSYGT